MYVYKYSIDIYLLCMIKVRIRWCTGSLWRMLYITLSKLIGILLFLVLKTKKIQGIAISPCNGNHFSSIYIYVSVCMSTVCQIALAELRGPNTRMLKVSFGQLKPTCDTRIIHLYY